MRYCLIGVIFALAGMYYIVLGGAYAGWLPPATPEELQAIEVRRLEALSATGQPSAVNEVGAYAAAAGVAKPHDGGTESSACAYTPCDAPVVTEPTDIDSAF
jgi:hypothetical protein